MPIDSLQVVEQTQEAVAATATSVAETAELVVTEPSLITRLLGDLNFGGDPEFWPSMLLMTVIGFGVVFAVLVLLIFVMKGMGAAFTRQKKAEKAAKAAAAGVAVADDDHHEAISDQEIAAAIITALKLYKSNLHDQESEMLTINRIARAYSPWNSKIHGLTQVPEHK